MRTSLLLGPALAVVAASLPDAAAEPPRLAVVISVDQMRYDYLDRFAPHFGADGFQRLRAHGADFRDAHYRHGTTKTGPGHATILSGTHANVNGIVGNEWIDRTTWHQVAGVEDAESPLVGAEPRAGRSPGGIFEVKSGRSPRRFLATTVGDEIKLRHGERSRVISVGNKDRAAILMGGHLADGVYWIDRGRFVTSSFYAEALPAWVEDFNAEERVEAFGRGVPAGRLDLAAFDRTVTAALDTAYGALSEPLYWAVRDGFGYHLRPDALAAKGITVQAAARVVQAALAARSEVQMAYAREDLTGGGAMDALGESVRRGYHHERSPDVLYVTKPYFMDKRPAGTNHGSPYVYDTHVPLLWYGAGVPVLRSAERVGVDDLAPTLSSLLGLPAPAQSGGRQLF